MWYVLQPLVEVPSNPIEMVGIGLGITKDMGPGSPLGRRILLDQGDIRNLEIALIGSACVRACVPG